MGSPYRLSSGENKDFMFLINSQIYRVQDLASRHMYYFTGNRKSICLEWERKVIVSLFRSIAEHVQKCDSAKNRSTARQSRAIVISSSMCHKRKCVFILFRILAVTCIYHTWLFVYNIPDGMGIQKCWFLKRNENLSQGKKPSRSKARREPKQT